LRKEVCFLASLREDHAGEGKGSGSGMFSTGQKAGAMVCLRRQWSSGVTGGA